MRYRLSIILLLFIGLIFSNESLYAFLPYVKNYTRDEYNAASQNWSIGRDSNGIMYIANHNGLLVYDGCNWSLHPLKGRTIVRSVFVDSDDRIFVGAYEEFGYFVKNEYGDLQYTSLADLLKPGLLHNQQVWSITRIGDDIYFQSFGGLFIYKKDGTVEFRKESIQLFMFHNINGNIYTSRNKRLSKFDGTNFITEEESPHKFHIKSIMPYKGNSMLVLTETDGIWQYQDGTYTKWQNDIDNEL